VSVSNKRRLREHGLVAKKSFGQNFLEDHGMAERIALAACDPPGGVVLEIGAGLGALTEPLRERAARVIAIERDRDLVPILHERFGDSVTVLEADAVQHDWWAELENGPAPRVVCGNLPYQITGRLIERAVALADRIDRAVFMVQREVAERLRAQPGGRDYGVLSVFSQAAFEIERLLKARPGAFCPPPKVASEVVVLTPHRPARAEETTCFRRVVKSAFAQRRKTLRNAWAGLDVPRDCVEACAAAADISLDARAETLSIEQFSAMAAELNNRVRDACP